MVTMLHKVTMTSAHMAIGDYCFKQQCNKILAQCIWIPIRYMINMAQCNYINKILTNKNPIKLFQLFLIPNRQAKPIRLNFQSKTKLSKSSLLHNGINFYNNLPTQIKQLTVKKFKMQIKKHFF